MKLGAQGIGLLRTEHMLFDPKRLAALRDVLMADSQEKKADALQSLQGYYYSDFSRIFSMASRLERSFPINIRLLDAPPSEFLSGPEVSSLVGRVGYNNVRGVQLALKTPGLYSMQMEAVLSAAQDTGYAGILSITIPLVRSVDEFDLVKTELENVSAKVRHSCKLCSMVETLEAVSDLHRIAAKADGLCIGTNDITSFIMGGIRRDDVEGTRDWMIKNNHVGKSPFETLALPVRDKIREIVRVARWVRPGIEIGVCGHQVAADSSSITFCHDYGISDISVPATFRILMLSRLMAGAAAAEFKREPVDCGYCRS
jgi:pyruvate,orthophosphate dikinase